MTVEIPSSFLLPSLSPAPPFLHLLLSLSPPPPQTPPVLASRTALSTVSLPIIAASLSISPASLIASAHLSRKNHPLSLPAPLPLPRPISHPLSLPLASSLLHTPPPLLSPPFPPPPISPHLPSPSPPPPPPPHP